jgi:hypothetical protein
MTKILCCRVENIMGAKLVEFAPNGDGVTIGGANGQGKSSALRGLVMALAGKSSIPEVPVHNGAESGSISVTLEDFVVHLEVMAGRESKLRCESRDGRRYASPQSMLDALFGNLAFDPGKFRSLDKTKQVKTLLELVGVNLDRFDYDEKTLMEQRTEENRTIKQLEGQLAEYADVGDVSRTGVNVATLLDEQRAAIAEENSLRDLKEEIHGCETAISDALRRIEEYRQFIRNAESQIEYFEEQKKQLNESLSIRPSVRSRTDIDTDISQADSINRIAERRCQKDALEQKHQIAIALSLGLSEKIETVRKDRESTLAAAPFPIPGLSFAEGSVTYNGVPFAQLSESEQWEVSTAISFALNKQGIVFMSNSGGLDRRSRERIRARAAELGVQLFLEVVDDADDVQILIEDGTVKENRL